MYNYFPVIDLCATGKNIVALRKARGLTVKDIQNFFGFEEPQAVYKWQQGKSLPTVDNLLALSVLLGVSIEQILVCKTVNNKEQQAKTCCSVFYSAVCDTSGLENISVNFCVPPESETEISPPAKHGH